MRAVSGQPEKIAHPQDSNTSGLRTSTPGAACYPKQEPGKSTSMSAPPLAAGGIAAGAKNRGSGHKLSCAYREPYAYSRPMRLYWAAGVDASSCGISGKTGNTVAAEGPRLRRAAGGRLRSVQDFQPMQPAKPIARDKLAIGQCGEAVDWRVNLQPRYFRAGLRIPESYGPVIRRARGEATVR